MSGCVAVSCDGEHDGQALLFKSTDAFEWQFNRVLDKNGRRYGRMWECPDFFELDGEQVMTITFDTEPTADGISFFADGAVRMDLEKYDLQ